MKVLLVNGSPHQRRIRIRSDLNLQQQMPVVTSRYWNMVHGNTPDEVRKV